MPSDLDLARLANSTARRVADSKTAPIANAVGRGFVAAVDGRKAAVSKNVRDAEPTPGFDVPAWMDLRPGDYVLFREIGSDRVITAPLDRNAAFDWNPLSRPGQIIIAGPDGTPTVIEPPADPTLDYALEWDGVTQRPVWVPR